MAEKQDALDVKQVVESVLNTIDKEREREIVSRRFGLYDRKETLEQIGELLGITRERVRQLEKAIVTRLKVTAEQGTLSQITKTETTISTYLAEQGSVTRVSNVTKALVSSDSKVDQSRVAFIGLLAPDLVSLDENDFYHQAICLKHSYSDDKKLTSAVQKIVETVKEIGKPVTAEKLNQKLGGKSAQTTQSLASVSKLLASLNGDWGLSKWPTVNPKNIRDKIFVILKENGNQLHFSEIAEKIKQSDFKRKDVTTQAIHNELIKDSRFVLVGRGIYALKEWGYKKGTVADVIAEILKKAEEPLHRDEIVKRVLENRYVKETTILLNLQGKAQFKRVAKATYALSEE